MRKLRIMPLIKCCLCLLVFILIIFFTFCLDLCVKRFGFSTVGELGNFGIAYYEMEKGFYPPLLVDASSQLTAAHMFPFCTNNNT